MLFVLQVPKVVASQCLLPNWHDFFIKRANRWYCIRTWRHAILCSNARRRQAVTRCGVTHHWWQPLKMVTLPYLMVYIAYTAAPYPFCTGKYIPHTHTHTFVYEDRSHLTHTHWLLFSINIQLRDVSYNPLPSCVSLSLSLLLFQAGAWQRNSIVRWQPLIETW